MTQITTWRFDPNASYVVVGGLGGCGRAILRWMANKGATNIIVPSRSGASSQAAKDIVAELAAKAVRVIATRCDASSTADLSSLLQDCAEIMPPVKGCINAAMVLQVCCTHVPMSQYSHIRGTWEDFRRLAVHSHDYVKKDALFENMTHQQWAATIKSKVNTSWNLHSLLPNLDFFIMLSSLVGIYGSMSQTNYAAGCSFQDSLAQYRNARGLPAISLNLGWMRTIGIVAENDDYRRYRQNAHDMAPVEESDLLALLDDYCDPSSGVLGVNKSQLLVGAFTPADFHARGEEPPFQVRPLFGGFDEMRLSAKDGTNGVGNLTQQTVAALFQEAEGFSARREVVVGAMNARLARALGVEAEDINSHKGFSEYGVDSLMAVELRNWVQKDFNASISVFEIMSTQSINEVGALVVKRVEDTK